MDSMNSIDSIDSIDLQQIKFENIPLYDDDVYLLYNELNTNLKTIIDLIYDNINVKPKDYYRIYSYLMEGVIDQYGHIDSTHNMFCKNGWNYCSKDCCGIDYDGVFGLLFYEIPEGIELIIQYGHYKKSPTKWYQSQKYEFMETNYENIVTGKIYVIPEFQQFRIGLKKRVDANQKIKFLSFELQTSKARPNISNYWDISMLL